MVLVAHIHDHDWYLLSSLNYCYGFELRLVGHPQLVVSEVSLQHPGDVFVRMPLWLGHCVECQQCICAE
jgi:hypothetical protein